MPEEEFYDDPPGEGSARIVKYVTIVVAPDECSPPPTAKQVLKAEEVAMMDYLAMLRHFRSEGLVVAMTYLENGE